MKLNFFPLEDGDGASPNRTAFFSWCPPDMPPHQTPAVILVIDDNPDDRTLAARELGRALPDWRTVPVPDAKTFQETLAAGNFSLVVTDYQLHWTNGLAVLQQVKERWPHIPVVMFTGTGDEEVAVEGMKRGLHDYVLKRPSQYARLAAAVQRAMESITERRRRVEAETRFSRLFDTVPLGLCRATRAGTLLDANTALADLLGQPNKSSLVGTSLAQCFADPADFARWQAELYSTGRALKFEARWQRRDGTSVWVEHNTHIVAVGDSEPICEGSVEDITKRKEAEQQRERLIADLQHALAHISTLTGLLPICSYCKKIRDEHNEWTNVETYIQRHSEAEFTHSYCPECVRSRYPDIARAVLNPPS